MFGLQRTVDKESIFIPEKKPQPKASRPKPAKEKKNVFGKNMLEMVEKKKTK